MEQCSKSSSSSLRDFAFSECVSNELFNFYLEWTEKNQHRSMRQVVELLAALLLAHPSALKAHELRRMMTKKAVSIIAHQGAQPLVKPAFKFLECLLSKKAISSLDVFECYLECVYDALGSWKTCISLFFGWMTYTDTAPAAGKFLVALILSAQARPIPKSLVYEEQEPANWQSWITDDLTAQPGFLESIRYYFLTPLFKADRAGALDFLQKLTTKSALTKNPGIDLDLSALLLLSAIEVGKKCGLVTETGKQICLCLSDSSY